MALRPGMLIGNNVRLVRLLGQGGMGAVWVANHETLHTQVAVKFMITEMSESAEAVTRFTREASAAAQIKSPHVVQTFDHGVTNDGIPYIVMELLEGEDLAVRVSRDGALPPRAVAVILSQVCKALGRAHSLGIIHRDIKPENIFLSDQDGELLVKVLDFGIAKRSEDAALSMTGTGAMVGTPYYMSPEQVMSAKGVDARTDLWSLAVVAYQALTGKVPFDAETMGALCVAINAAVFAPPSVQTPGLSHAIDSWFATALARDPSARFQSAKELAAAFQRAAGVLDPATAETSGLLPAPRTLLSSVERPPAAEPLMPASAGTLMEASVTTSRRSPRAWAIAAVAGGAAALVAFGVIGVVALRGRTKSGGAPSVEAVVENAAAPSAVVPAAPAPPLPVETAAPAATSSAPSETTAPAQPAEAPPAKAGTKPKKVETKPPAAPPATPKPKEKYGF
ncbi:MAG: serine/threonine protein kinase [Myxococcales bacterium]|nr:serine/threonine protein kinase [Myxococcales bacterium]